MWPEQSLPSQLRKEHGQERRSRRWQETNGTNHRFPRIDDKNVGRLVEVEFVALAPVANFHVPVQAVMEDPRSQLMHPVENGRLGPKMLRRNRDRSHASGSESDN
jgi:hypothetical protein